MSVAVRTGATAGTSEQEREAILADAQRHLARTRRQYRRLRLHADTDPHVLCELASLAGAIAQAEAAIQNS
jgi:hypothetical protein